MPAGNVNINYSEIIRVSAVMKQAVENIVPMLQSTKTSVEGLMDNGLFMQQSSPAIKASYEKLTVSLTQAMTGITVFAKQFEEIKTQVEALDTAVAKNVGGS
ncbi:hypothetical protein AB0G74_05550 [Streptomyces sp. NPDC020875]|uniref:hypothetical protein n=1 Tax=Streptomyces sp. NPDC020875 TaxID=3154898 RepID=UPI0033EBA50A